MSSPLSLFLPPALLFAFSPGAGNFLAMRNGARYGSRAAILGFSGRFVSFLVLFLAVAIGLGALIAASETALTIIKWCGVTYLVWLGVQTLWVARRSPETDEPTEPESPAADQPGVGVLVVARQEFFTSITNPKALLLVSAFLPQFVTPGPDARTTLIILGGIYIGLEFAAACLWARTGSVMSHGRLRARTRRWFTRATGGLMIATGGWLALFSARAASIA